MSWLRKVFVGGGWGLRIWGRRDFGDGGVVVEVVGWGLRRVLR